MAKKHTIQGTSSSIRCILEKEDFEAHPEWWKCVYNSEKYPDGSTRRVHTRVYQLKIGEVLCDVGFKFTYDYEKDKASCTFDILGEKALRHIKAGDFDPEIFKDGLFKKEHA